MWRDPTCPFCPKNEIIEHLFFRCPMARITWGIIGRCFGANDILRNLNQYKIWIAKWLPGGELIYSNRCASVCWTIWKCRNKACFDKKHIKNISEFIICACSFLTYWTGLYNEVKQERILDGVQQLLACAHKVLADSSKKLVSSAATSPSDDAQDKNAPNWRCMGRDREKVWTSVAHRLIYPSCSSFLNW